MMIGKTAQNYDFSRKLLRGSDLFISILKKERRTAEIEYQRLAF